MSSHRYHVRWPLLFTVIGLLLLLPLVLWIAFGLDITPFVVAWVLIGLVGAGGAGLRNWLGEDPSDVAQRYTDRQFEPPRDKSGLL
jgi:hypothetical protein